MYCYLYWFPVHRRAFAKRKFGPNPFVSDVLLQLYIDYESDYLIQKPVIVGYQQLHIEEYFDRTSLSEVFLKYAGSKMRVGYNGYCYLQWFRDLSFPEWKILLFADRLGAYPLLQDVFAVLMREVRNLYSNVRILRPTSRYGLVHVSSAETVWRPLYMIIHASRDFMKQRFIIGATPSQLSNELARSMLTMAGVNQDEAVKTILAERLKDPRSEEVVNLMKALADITCEQLSRNRPKVYPRASATPLQQSRLAELYPEFQLDFSKSGSLRGHSMAANLRLCNIELMMARLSYNNKVQVPNGYDCWVKDVGGNLLQNLNRAWYSTHACLPIIDARDNLRRSNEILAVHRIAQKNEEMRTHLSVPKKMYCNDLAQCCDVKAPFLVFNDSIYDITNEQVANAMDAAAAEVAYATFLFDPQILMSEFDSGELQDVGMVWKKHYGNCFSKNAVKEGKKYVTEIEFYFKNDYSISYRHNFKTYLQSVLDMRYVSERGILYLGEIVESRGPYLVLKIVKTVYDSPASDIAVVIPLSEKLLQKVVVQYYTYEPLVMDKSGEFKVNFTQRSMVVSKRLYAAGLKYAMAQTQAKFSNNAIFEYLRSVSTRLIVNGMDASLQEIDMAPLDLYHLADALFLIAFSARYNSSAAITIITDFIKKHRKAREESLFMRIVKKLFSNTINSLPFVSDGAPSVDNHIKAHDLNLDDSEDTKEFTLLQRLSLWAAAPEFFKIKITEATRITEVRNHVAEIAYDYTEMYFNPRDLSFETEPQKFSEDVEKMADAIVKRTVSNVIDVLNIERKDAPDVVPEEQVQKEISLIPEAPYVNKECRYKSFEEITPVPGDGNCLFHSLATLTNENIRDLKTRLLGSKFLTSCVDVTSVVDILTADCKWGDDDIILLFCREQGVNICLHNKAEDKTNCFFFRGRETDEVALHLLLLNNHFSPLKLHLEGGFELDRRVCSLIPPPTAEQTLVDPIRTYIAKFPKPNCDLCGDVSSFQAAEIVEIISRYPDVISENVFMDRGFGVGLEAILIRTCFENILDEVPSNGETTFFFESGASYHDVLNVGDCLVLRFPDWLENLHVDTETETLSTMFESVNVFKPDHSWIHTGTIYAICLKYGKGTSDVQWERSRQQIVTEMCNIALKGSYAHECRIWELLPRVAEFESFHQDFDLCCVLSTDEDDDIMRDLDKLSEELAETPEYHLDHDFNSDSEFDDMMPLPPLPTKSKCEERLPVVSLKIAGKNIFYHPSEYLISPVKRPKRKLSKNYSMRIAGRSIFRADPPKFALPKKDKEDTLLTDDLLIAKRNLFNDNKNFYKLMPQIQYMQPATIRTKCLGLLKTKVSSQGVVKTSIMGLTIKKKQIKTPNPVRPIPKTIYKETVKADPGRETNCITVTLPEAENKNTPRLSPTTTKRCVLYERDKKNFDRIGAINRPAIEVPVLNALSEVSEPNGIEVVFVDRGDTVLLGSRYLLDETVSNISRALFSTGSVSADRFFTLFSHNRMICVVKMFTSDHELELSNFIKIIGCLYPDTRSFYLNKMSRLINVVSLIAIFDNYQGSYPHKFLTIGESKEDCRYIVDHYQRVARVNCEILSAEQKVNALWERSNSTYVNFEPNYESGYTSESHVRNSAREIREYWRTSSNIVYGVYKRFYDLNCRKTVFDPRSLREACDLSSEKFRVVRMLMNPAKEEVSIEPIVSSTMSDGAYEVFFDGAKFVQWIDLKEGRVPITDRYYLTGKSLKLMQDELLYKATKDVDISALSLEHVNINFVQGVPGCGKTHCIVENVPLEETRELQIIDKINNCVWNETVKPCLVLTPTRESAEEIKNRLQRKGIEKTHLRDIVMTIDSYLLNYRKKGKIRYDQLIVEEALMLHAGQIVFALAITGARSLMFIGDEKQIPFINRLGHCHLKYVDPLSVFSNIKRERLSVSFRCTATVAAVLGLKYTDGMFSVNNISGECQNRKFQGVTDIEKPKTNVVYLTFKQSEKDDLKKKKFDPVYTVHEFQGKQEDNVVVIRMSSKKEEIYSSEEHALVAFSRHRKSLVYYSPTHDDALGKLISRARAVHSVDIKKVLRTVESVKSPVIKDLVPSPIVDSLVNQRIENQRSDDVFDNMIQSLATGDFTNKNFREGRRRSFVKLEGGFLRTVEQPLKNFNNVTEAIYTVTKKFRDYDQPTLIPIEDVEEYKMPERPSVLVPNLELSDISLLQTFYDQVFPGNSLYDYTFDPYIVQTENINVNLEDTEFNPDYKYNSYKTRVFDKLRPNLRTAMPVNRPNTQVESLLAMIKRNQSVPDLGGFADIDKLSDIMIKRFNSLLKPDALPLLKIYQDNPIVPNSVSVRNWLLTQSGETLNAIEQPEDILIRPHSNYNFMIKPNVKPQLDASAPFTYSALQTIAYSDKSVNVNYCPMFRELVDRVVPMLMDHLIVNTGMAPDELDNKLTKVCRKNNLNLALATALEVDMSKYDKSQGELMLSFEEKFLRQFGFDEEFIISWVRSHKRTILTDMSNKVRCRVSYQRKSGDASTFTMNTFYLMAMLATLLPLEDAKLACFSGDDSLIMGGSEFNVNLSSITAILFNMESKYLRTYKYNYFCSKFILQDAEGFVKLIPDPVKLVTKFGRHDIANWEHLEEYRISLEDLTKAYANMLDYSELAKAVCERYNVVFSVEYVFPVIYNFCRNQTLFRTLFHVRPEDRLCLDPSVSKFD